MRVRFADVEQEMSCEDQKRAVVKTASAQMKKGILCENKNLYQPLDDGAVIRPSPCIQQTRPVFDPPPQKLKKLVRKLSKSSCQKIEPPTQDEGLDRVLKTVINTLENAVEALNLNVQSALIWTNKLD